MATAAEIVVLINAKDQMSAVLHSASSSLGTFSTQTGQAAKTLAGFGTTAAVAGLAAVAGGFGLAIKEAAEFEHVMSGVKAVSNAAAPDMANLSSLALQLGADTKFSATEAGRGIEELLKAGVGIGDVLGGAAAASLNLAAAGEIDVAESAIIASNALNVFGKNGSEMTHVADLIAGSSVASAADVHGFGLSLAAAGAVAAAVGFSFDDLATGISVMAQNGIKGSDAGTSLKTMMLNLQPVTDKQVSLFKELGIVTADGANQFFDASGKVKSLADVAGVLQTALAGMTQQQQLAALEVMFGSDAIRAAAILAKEGADGFNKMSAAMAGITAESVANERLNNLQGSLEKLKGSLQTAAVAIGMAFLPALREITDAITVLVNENMPQLEAAATAMAAAFVAALPSIVAFFQTLIDNRETIAQVAVGFAALVVISTVIGWVVGLISAFAALGAALATVASLFAPLVAGVAAVGTALVALGSALTSIGAVAALAWSSIAAGAGVFSTLGAAAALIIGILGGPLVVAIVAVIAVIALLTAAWVTNWGDIQGVTEAAVDAIGAAITAAGEFFTNLVATIQTAWSDIQAATDSAGQTLTEGMTTTWAAVQSATDSALATLGAAIIAAWEQIFNSDTRAAFAALVVDAQTTWDAVVALVAAALALLTANITTAWAAIQAAIIAASAAITADVTAAWAAIEAAITVAMAAITASVESGWAAVQAATTSANTTITSAVESAWNSMAPTVSSALNSVSSAATSGWNSIKSSVQDILNSLVSAAGAAGSAMVNAWARGVTSRISAALSAARKMADEVRSLLNKSDAKKGPLSDVTAAGRALPETLAKGILQGTPGLLRTVSAMAGGMASLTGMSGGLSMATAGGSVSGTGAGGATRSSITIQVNAPVYGVNDMEDVVIRSLERAQRRGRA